MKFLILIFIFSMADISLSYAQSAEEIISRIQEVYSTMENYVDEGKSTTYIYEQNLPFSKDFTIIKNHVTAHDQSGNIFHYVSKDKGNGVHAGEYLFTQTAGELQGLLHRLYANEPDSSFMPIQGAVGALGLGSGSIFHSVSLHYPDHFTFNGKGFFDHFSEINRLQDSLINSEECYQIQLKDKREITQEILDRSKIYSDSVSRAEGKVIYEYFDEPKPFTAFIDSRYFIRKSDNLIVREEFYNTSGENIGRISRAIELNPRINIDNFEKYLGGKN